MKKTLIFDAFGTLLDIQYLDNLLTKLFDKKGISIGMLWRQKQLEYSWLRALMNRYTSFSQITADALIYSLEKYHINVDLTIVNKLIKEYQKLPTLKETKETIEILSQYHNLMVLSNADTALLTEVLEYNELIHSLNAILSADQVKSFKPNPIVYQLALDKIKLPKEQVYFVSSNTWDVAGAKSFGFKTIWINRNGKKLEEMGYFPDIIISSILELTNIDL